MAPLSARGGAAPRCRRLARSLSQVLGAEFRPPRRLSARGASKAGEKEAACPQGEMMAGTRVRPSSTGRRMPRDFGGARIDRFCHWLKCQDQGGRYNAQYRGHHYPDGKTKLTMRMLFDSAEERDAVASKYGAIEGANQRLERLAQHLAKRLGSARHVKKLVGPKGLSCQASGNRCPAWGRLARLPGIQ